jgi:flavin-dependent thymidylate synthase
MTQYGANNDKIVRETVEEAMENDCQGDCKPEDHCGEHGIQPEEAQAMRETGVQKWIDPAMYAAEAMPAKDGPKVHLLWMTPDPLGAAAACNAIYTGKVARNLADVTRAEREALLPDMRKTILTTPMEAISLHFLIEGVTRAFTHQLVRNRTSGYAQESMRFAVMGAEEQGRIPIALPPSLTGTLSEEEWYAQKDVDIDHTEGAQRQRLIWDDSLRRMENAYSNLVSRGMPAEDARGLLPTNTLTRIHWVTNLRSLQAEAGKRLSTQAQFEWRAVIAAIARAIREYNPYENLAKIVLTQHEKGADYINTALEYLAASDSWQYEAISDLFRPVCYNTGKCEFMATADRFCTIRDRVEANHAIGRPSSEWHEGYAKDLQFDVTGKAVGAGVVIEPIHPAEWLADPTAAR